MLAISIEGSDDLARVRRATKDISVPVALASAVQAEGYGRQSRIPMTFVIDRQGVLRLDGYKFAKVLDKSMLEKIVLPLLRGANGTALANAGAH